MDSLKALGSISRSRLMNLAREVELELQEKKTGWTGSRVFGSRGSSGWSSTFRSSGFSSHGCHNMVRAQNNDWVYVKGAKESPDKGGTSLGPKQKPRTEN